MESSDNPKIIISSASPKERRSFLKKLGAFAVSTAALGGFTNLRAKNTYSGTEVSTYASDQSYIASISLFAGNFAPRAWALCEGQLLSIGTHQALFSLIGTTFGGDGRTTMALPDLRGRTPIGPGTGPGLPSYREGQQVGTPTKILTVDNLPTHNHAAAITSPTTYSGIINAKTGPGGADADPTDNYLRNSGADIYSSSTPNATMGTNSVAISPQAVSPNNYGTVTVGNTGGQQAFSIMQPSLAIYFIICMVGIFPSRS